MANVTEHFVIVSPGKDVRFMMTPTSDGSYAVDCPGIARFYVSGHNSVGEARAIIQDTMRRDDYQPTREPKFID